MKNRHYFTVVAAVLFLSAIASADAPDLSTPKGALHAYLVAVESGDADGLKACLFNFDPETVELQCSAMANIREMDELGATMFASSPRPKPAHPKSVDELVAQANKDYETLSQVAIPVKGDTASIWVGRGAIKFRKIDEQWKVDGDAMFKDTSPENKRRDLLVFRLTLKVREPLKQELADGKFKDWPAVEAALRQRLSAVLASDAEYQAADKAWRGRFGAVARRPQTQTGGDVAAGPPTDEAAVTAGQTAIVGGKGGGEFSQESPTGGPVIGFRYSFGNWMNRRILRQLDPMFEPPTVGHAPTGDEKMIAARSGYVVGGLLVDTDNVAAVAVRVIFVGFKDGKIDPKITYTSDWIGVPSRIHQEQLAARGRGSSERSAARG